MSAVLELVDDNAERLAARTVEALIAAVKAGLEPLQAVPPLKLADWAAKHFRLAGDSSHLKGGWTAWPPQVGILDAFSDDRIEQVDVMKAKRVGYTKMLVAFCGYEAAHRHRKLGLWQPTDDDRDSFVASEIDPMIVEVPAVARMRRRGWRSGDRTSYKRFRSSVQHYLGGKAARAYRRITLDDAILDEADGFDQQVEKSADPPTLAKGRLEGAPFPKFICGSTPRLKGFSHVEREASHADARLRFHIDCPHCGVEHPLLWGGPNVAHGFKWTDRNPATVVHVCPHCHGTIRQPEYERQANAGACAWVCTATGLRYGSDREWRDASGQPTRPPRHVAFLDYWTAYSSQRTWPDIVREFLEAHQAKQGGNNGPMMGFYNEVLARTWEEDFEQGDAEVLRRRAQSEGLRLGVVPRGGLEVYVTIDVQRDRWELSAWAFGRDAESWCIEHRVIYGDTSDQQQWIEKLDPVLDWTFPHAGGQRLRVEVFAIDTGYQTHMAYWFCHRNKHRRIYATKGDGAIGKAIKAGTKKVDINFRGRVMRNGIKLWHVGTDTAKDLLHGRLQLEGAGKGRVHFAADLPHVYFDQLVAEQRVPVRGKRGIELRWELPSGRRNETLDCAVMAAWCAELREIERWTDAQCARAARALEPDLFDGALPAVDDASPPLVEPPTAPVAAPPPPRSVPRPAPVAPAVVGSDEWNSRL